MGRQLRHTGLGPSQRQLRVGEQIRRALAETLGRGDVHDGDLDGMSITIGEARCSPDLRRAKVYVLPLGGGDRARALDALNRNRARLRRAVNDRLKLRFSPELRFVIDESFDRMDETRRLLGREDVRRDTGG